MFFSFLFSLCPIFSLFLFFLNKCVSSFFFFFLKTCRFQRLYQGLTKDVASVVGAPWRCSVLTTQVGKAGNGLNHLLGREHDSTPKSGVEAPRLKKTVPLQIVILLLMFGTLRDVCMCAPHPHARSYANLKTCRPGGVGL